MENWQYELDKAREEGRKEGVTIGYKNGFKDASRGEGLKIYQDGLAVGYLSGHLDALDALEQHRQGLYVEIGKVVDSMALILSIREVGEMYLYSKPVKDDTKKD